LLGGDPAEHPLLPFSGIRSEPDAWVTLRAAGNHRTFRCHRGTSCPNRFAYPARIAAVAMPALGVSAHRRNRHRQTVSGDSSSGLIHDNHEPRLLVTAAPLRAARAIRRRDGRLTATATCE
jgi:hypothetical protein